VASHPVDDLSHDQYQREHPDDVEADDREHVGLLVLVTDHDVAGEVHHTRHHGKAREGCEHGGGNAGATQDLPKRRGRHRHVRLALHEPGARELERDRSWVRPDQEGDAEADDAHRGGGEPGDDERLELELLPCEQGSEHKRPERSAEERAEEDVRDRASLHLLWVHVRGRRSGQQDGTVHRAHPDEPEDHQRGAVHDAPERGQDAREHSHDETARDHRYTTEPVHQASRGECGGGAGSQEDGRAEAEDRLDAGDEDEGDRRNGDGELQHAREENEAEAEQGRVTPDRIRDRRDRAIQPARPCRSLAGPVTTAGALRSGERKGSSGQPG
jgi:hypothetical protein